MSIRRIRRITLLDRLAVRSSLIPLNVILTKSVSDASGHSLGRVIDVVVKWSGDAIYPDVKGMVIKDQNSESELLVPASKIEVFQASTRTIRYLGAGPGKWERRRGELRLEADVIGRQIVDVQGASVVIAKELYLAWIGQTMYLVGVSGPEKRRGLKALSKVDSGLIDWSLVQPFGEADSELKLKELHEGLRRLRPGELADLLQELDDEARDEFTASMDLSDLADAVEEMEPEEVEDLMVDTPPEVAAKLIEKMEPDEAVDALRDLGRAEADEILAKLPPEVSEALEESLEYPETMAGGFMTTVLVISSPQDTISEVAEKMRAAKDHSTDIDATVVVDENGKYLGDVHLFDLFIADSSQAVGSLLGEHDPLYIDAEAPLREVVKTLIEARSSSLVVVDEEGFPIGRVLADDVVDALERSSGFHFKLPWNK
ncbi:magnesium transporter MgtE N-terminal domain-containing protein [Ferrithrix thermotolerans]|uniref:magnesium transporter MgtE N-terminal domain-containing protein n=1 Tax=Ferrithrix thermotolerans TaxID=209649 RepID=UPI0011606C1A|nr:CBS domain-containing protein [Ferrithrix thermotolerans]